MARLTYDQYRHPERNQRRAQRPCIRSDCGLRGARAIHARAHGDAEELYKSYIIVYMNYYFLESGSRRGGENGGTNGPTPADAKERLVRTYARKVRSDARWSRATEPVFRKVSESLNGTFGFGFGVTAAAAAAAAAAAGTEEGLSTFG
jgi:hypothetical protein